MPWQDWQHLAAIQLSDLPFETAISEVRVARVEW